MSEPDILAGIDAGIGRIRLNRARQINALTVPMMHTIAGLLEDYAADDAVTAVELTGSGERGLCAGADVRALRELALTGGDVRDFFETEYGVNLAIAGFGKPYTAVMTGITMGGGLGLSAHGSRRVVDATSRLAMPETQIGLFPDVLMTPLLARMPGRSAPTSRSPALRSTQPTPCASGWPTRSPAALPCRIPRWRPAGSQSATPAMTRWRSSNGWPGMPTRQRGRRLQSCAGARRCPSP